MPELNQATFAVKGMSCSGCVASVTRVIRTVPGAEPLQVEIGRAQVRLEPERATAGQVRDALSRAGYEATQVE